MGGKTELFFLHLLFHLDLVSMTLGAGRAQDPSQGPPHLEPVGGAGTA